MRWPLDGTEGCLGALRWLGSRWRERSGEVLSRYVRVRDEVMCTLIDATHKNVVDQLCGGGVVLWFGQEGCARGRVDEGITRH